MIQQLTPESLAILRNAILENLTGAVRPGRSSGGRVSGDGNPMAGGRWESRTASVSGSSKGTVMTPQGELSYEAELEGSVSSSWDESTGCGSSLCPEVEEEYGWDVAVTCGDDSFDTEPLQDILCREDDVISRLGSDVRDAG